MLEGLGGLVPAELLTWDRVELPTGAVRHEAVPAEDEPPGAFAAVVSDAARHPLLSAHAGRRREALRLSRCRRASPLSHSELYGDLLHRSGVEYPMAIGRAGASASTCCPAIHTPVLLEEAVGGFRLEALRRLRLTARETEVLCVAMAMDDEAASLGSCSSVCVPCASRSRAWKPSVACRRPPSRRPGPPREHLDRELHPVRGMSARREKRRTRRTNAAGPADLDHCREPCASARPRVGGLRARG
jgi:hypothetical protein